MTPEAIGWPGTEQYGPDGWPFEPAIYAGGVPQLPLAFDFPAEIETPDAQRLFPFELPHTEGAGPSTLPPSLGLLRSFGQLWWPAEAARVARDVPDAVATEHPYASNEKLEWFDVAECIEVTSDRIAPGGRVWELARRVVHRYNLVTVERIGFRATVTALDEEGDPLATYVLDGYEPCAVPVVHPDPAVTDPLAFRFVVLLNRQPSSGDGVYPPLLAGALPNQVPSDSPIVTWNDLRFGWTEGWPHLNQFTDGGRAILRYFVTLAGETDRWDVRMLGRLSGYTQQPGRLEAAHRNAVYRL